MTRSVSEHNESGRSLITTGKDPLILDDPGTLICVVQGIADVFFVTRDIDGKPLSRRHMAQVGQGDIIPGMRPETLGGVIMIVGIGEAELRLDRFSNLLENPPPGEQMNLGQWFAQCVTATTVDHGIPRHSILAEAPGTLDLEEGQSLRVQGRDWFVTSLTGEVGFLDVKLQTLHAPLPIPENSWLTATMDSCVTLARVSDFKEMEDPEGSVQFFHRCVTKSLAIQGQQEVNIERSRYQRRLTGEKRRMTEALQGMASIIQGRDKVSIPHDLPPLLAACVSVGKACGTSIAKDTANPKTGMNPALEDIARHNRFRTRQVIIAEKWWDQDHGSLLAFREADGRPVALIPRGRSAYVCVDSVTGEKQAVNGAVADALKPEAYMFYRPFPPKRLNWINLLHFGIFQSGMDFTWLITMGCFAGLLGLLTPLATGIIVGTFIPNAAKNDIVQITLILVATAIAIALFNVVKGISSVRMEGRMDLSIQAAVWDRLLSLPVPFFKDYTSGDLAVRSMGISAIRQILSGATLNAVLIMAFSSFNLLFIFYYDWQMALVAIALAFIGAMVTFTAGIFTIYYQKSLFEIQGGISGTMLQFITGINKLRSTGAEDRAFAVFAQEYKRQKQMNFNSGKVDAALTAFNSAFPILVSMVIFAWYYWMRPGHLSVAEFIAFTAAYTTFQTALLQVSMVMPNTANIIPLYQRARPIFNALPEFNDASKKPGRLNGSIDISHVSFRYSPKGPLILNNVSLSAGKGEFIAIVGGSGAGKSTLLRLLLGFETPDSGSVLFDNQELKNLDVREVRRQVGVVLQNGKLMNGDIFHNIVGTSNLTKEDAWEAARMVGIAEDLEAMPMKMSTIVPAGGGSLSGGQRQRLLIARAIANHPRILFFDEATSALDNQTQAIVSESLEKLKVTRIVIAHRLSTIINADKIYTMHLGKVVEAGTYEELMAQKGYFYELAKRQIS